MYFLKGKGTKEKLNLEIPFEGSKKNQKYVKKIANESINSNNPQTKSVTLSYEPGKNIGCG